MPKEAVLIVEDEESILELVSYNLIKQGYRVEAVSTGEEAQEAVRLSPPNLVLLDLMLPGVDGLDVCRHLKANPKTKQIPIVILTAKSEEEDIVRGLELGADDYITKPFKPKILIARIRAVLRRAQAAPPEAGAPIRVHGLSINPGRHEAHVQGEALQLSATEFRILSHLARHPGWVFTRAQIVDAVHGDGYPVTDRSIDVQIVGLRKKLGLAKDYIETVRGIGYRFKE